MPSNVCSTSEKSNVQTAMAELENSFDMLITAINSFIETTRPVMRQESEETKDAGYPITPSCLLSSLGSRIEELRAKLYSYTAYIKRQETLIEL